MSADWRSLRDGKVPLVLVVRDFRNSAQSNGKYSDVPAFGLIQ